MNHPKEYIRLLLEKPLSQQEGFEASRAKHKGMDIFAKEDALIVSDDFFRVEVCPAQGFFTKRVSHIIDDNFIVHNYMAMVKDGEEQSTALQYLIQKTDEKQINLFLKLQSPVSFPDMGALISLFPSEERFGDTEKQGALSGTKPTTFKKSVDEKTNKIDLTIATSRRIYNMSVDDSSLHTVTESILGHPKNPNIMGFIININPTTDLVCFSFSSKEISLKNMIKNNDPDIEMITGGVAKTAQKIANAIEEKIGNDSLASIMSISGISLLAMLLITIIRILIKNIAVKNTRIKDFIKEATGSVINDHMTDYEKIVVAIFDVIVSILINIKILIPTINSLIVFNQFKQKIPFIGVFADCRDFILIKDFLGIPVNLYFGTLLIIVSFSLVSYRAKDSTRNSVMLSAITSFIVFRFFANAGNLIVPKIAISLIRYAF